MPRALLYCVLFGALLLSVNAASMMCVKGRTSLTPSPGSPAREWCSSAPDGCTVDFAFTFDAESPNAQRWPLKASIGPLDNRTALVALFPELSDIGFQCAPSGDIVATTRIASNNERLRFIWGYSGVSSSSCAFTMSSVNLDADFVQFQALLAYSGYMSMFDAGSTTNDRRYSIAQLSSSANCASSPTVSSTSGGGSTTTPCSTISDCRYPTSVWQTKFKNHLAWQSVADKKFCGLSYRTIMLSSKATKPFGSNWLAEARELIAVALNAARTGCGMPLNLAFVEASWVYISDPLSCALNTPRSHSVSTLSTWNDQTSVCNMLVSGSGAGAEAETTGVKKAVNTKADTDNIFFILFIVGWALLGVVVILVCVCTCYCCWDSVKYYTAGFLQRILYRMQGIDANTETLLPGQRSRAYWPNANNVVPDQVLATGTVSPNTNFIAVKKGNYHVGAEHPLGNREDERVVWERSVGSATPAPPPVGAPQRVQPGERHYGSGYYEAPTDGF